MLEILSEKSNRTNSREKVEEEKTENSEKEEKCDENGSGGDTLVEQNQASTSLSNKDTSTESGAKNGRCRIKSDDDKRIIESESDSDDYEHLVRARKWTKCRARLDLNLQRVTSETIRALCPSLRWITEAEVDLRCKETLRASTRSHLVSTSDSLISSRTREDSADAMLATATDRSSTMGLNRKVLIVEDDDDRNKNNNDCDAMANINEKAVSPPRRPLSSILYISNLVRPFTVKQLQELLLRTGNIVPDGLCTDKIKSKCYVRYENEEQAELTRNTLHGVQWPIGNGKQLAIEYSTESEMLEFAAHSANVPVETLSKDFTHEPKHVQETKNKDGNEIANENGKTKTREWDVGKENLNGRKSEHRDSRNTTDNTTKRRRSRNRSPEEKSNRKQQKKEGTPIKHMDDLFKKTKTMPCIYWLPLSSETIAKKEQERIQRLERHKKRRDEVETNRNLSKKSVTGSSTPRLRIRSANRQQRD